MEKRILRSLYETAFRLGKVSDDRIKLDFRAGLRNEHIDQKIDCGLQKPPSSQPFFAACPSNQRLFAIVHSELISIKTCRTIPNHFKIDYTSHTCLFFHGLFAFQSAQVQYYWTIIGLTTETVSRVRCSGQDQNEKLPFLMFSLFRLCFVFNGEIYVLKEWVAVFVLLT